MGQNAVECDDYGCMLSFLNVDISTYGTTNQLGMLVAGCIKFAVIVCEGHGLGLQRRQCNYRKRWISHQRKEIGRFMREREGKVCFYAHVPQ